MNALNPKFYDNYLDNIHRNLDNGKAYWLAKNPDKEPTDFFNFLLSHMINFRSTRKLHYNADTKDYTGIKQYAGYTGAIETAFARKNQFPTLPILLAYCDIMGVSIDDLINTNIDYPSDSEISIPKQQSHKNESSLKYINTKGELYFYFPSRGDEKLIHECRLIVTEGLVEKDEMLLRLEIPLSPSTSKLYSGSITFHDNQTAIINLVNNKNASDYMLISIYDPSLYTHTYFHGTVGYRIASGASLQQNLPCVTKCLISTSKLSLKTKRDCESKWYSDKWLLGLFSIDENIVVIAKKNYKMIRDSCELDESIDTAFEYHSRNIRTGIFASDLLVLNITNAYTFHSKISEKKKIREFISKLKSNSLSFDLCPQIRLMDNEVVYKYIKYCGDHS